MNIYVNIFFATHYYILIWCLLSMHYIVYNIERKLPRENFIFQFLSLSIKFFHLTFSVIYFLNWKCYNINYSSYKHYIPIKKDDNEWNCLLYVSYIWRFFYIIYAIIVYTQISKVCISFSLSNNQSKKNIFKK